MAVESTSIFKLRLSTIFDSVFPGGLEMIRSNIDKNIYVRDIVEKHGAVTQCNNVIGKFKAPEEEWTDEAGVKQKGTNCWICGELIQMGDQVCEHAIPIAQTILFWGLYQKDKPNPKRDFLDLEYGWAHRAPCNSVKGAKVFIKDTYKGKVVVDDAALKNFVQEIATAKGVKDSKWIASRVDAMAARYGKIAAKLNEAFGVSLLSGVASLKNPERYKDVFRAILFGPEVELSPEDVYKKQLDNLTQTLKTLQVDLGTVQEGVKTQAKAFVKDYLNNNNFIQYHAYLAFNAMNEIDSEVALAFAKDYFELALINDLHTFKPDTSGRVLSRVRETLGNLYSKKSSEFMKKYGNYEEKTEIIHYYFMTVRDRTFPSEEEIAAAPSTVRFLNKGAEQEVTSETESVTSSPSSLGPPSSLASSMFTARTKRAARILVDIKNTPFTKEEFESVEFTEDAPEDTGSISRSLSYENSSWGSPVSSSWESSGEESEYSTEAAAKALVQIKSEEPPTKKARIDKGGRRKTYRLTKKSKRKTFRNQASRRTSPGRQRRQSQPRTR